MTYMQVRKIFHELKYVFKITCKFISVVEIVYFVVFSRVELNAFWDLKVPD